MNNRSDESPYWFEIANYIIDISFEHYSLKEFSNILLAKQVRIGRGYEDYSRALDRLQLEGLIKIDSGIILPGNINDVAWINESLLEGEQQAWDLVDKLEPGGEWGKKFDDSSKKETGLKGEKAVIKELKNKIDTRYHHKIRHISLNDDTVGFDIRAPSILDHEKNIFIEVKTTTLPGDEFIFYLSRNEFNIGLRMKNWILCFVKIVNSQPKILGHLELNQIQDLFPIEKSERVEWQSVRIEIPISLINEGLI
ncbi:MAG: DUF3883 domain-containing protein [Emcibacteraceae bacterium]|nr:DUF3883 domain-containing protein [Emcibacteraceae bacterium]